MKSLYILFFTLAVAFTSCNDSGIKDKSLLPSSVGNINSLQIITPNDLWNGIVGEAIRNNFAAPTDGLPQDEPLFSMNQMPPEAFSGFARSNRLFLYVVLSDENKATVAKDEYAKPQAGAVIKATSEEELVDLINKNAAKIIESFHASELKERQRRTSISLMKSDSLKKVMGVSMQIPSAYRIAKATDSFFWMRKDLKDGTTNILVYTVPLSMIKNDSTAVGDIIKIRDSIGSKLLPVEDEGQFITEDAYAPYLFKTKIDGKFAYETKGTWEVKGAWMGGPFINFAVRDEKNNRYLILEGFTYAPSAAKRDLQFELESILSTSKIE
ncbi:hypothetical protein Aeqsu_1217 [Aequorivita sublithincola DSM 14238]|uniref:DUF4837 domain-containing protein n=1 Tax=Aequorivita sublithincola (strain DSM 14238 / LMG 21431 / ACAM 643 / 9-3) TaxID=746697 RepID=I3YUP5_AEQSU|nr:DUF4837 family protein [Aequorivita sublithincola]AFL80713.1 hypothetical protein Aeqsu_1217 [Aequorivita sublithincola DSM 14238]